MSPEPETSMKTPRLPEIDLARYAAIATPETLDRLETELHLYNAGIPAGSYDPNRRSIRDILAARTSLLGVMPVLSWEQVLRQIRAACTRGEDQEVSNVEVARLLYEHSREHGWSSVGVTMESLPLGIAGSVRYWSDVVVQSGGDGLFIPFFDHRINRGLSNSAARRVVFSMQNVGIRERYPDVMDARLAVVRFPGERGRRRLKIDFHTENELLPYEDLNGRVQLVYETWARVSEERATETRRTGTEGPNPLGF